MKNGQRGVYDIKTLAKRHAFVLGALTVIPLTKAMPVGDEQAPAVYIEIQGDRGELDELVAHQGVLVDGHTRLAQQVAPILRRDREDRSQHSWVDLRHNTAVNPP